MITTNNSLQSVSNWFLQTEEASIVDYQQIDGGCICNAYRIRTNSEQSYFVKIHSKPPDNFFAAEAAGLLALKQSTSISVPKVIFHCHEFLLLSDLAPAKPTSNYWQLLAKGLAEVHHYAAPCFGFSVDNYCGETAQPNPRCKNGFEFFSEHRLVYQTRLAYDKGLLNRTDINKLHDLCTRLPELIPVQEPTLIHGDLWSGNVMPDSFGRPALIDPAAYWGWAEADIAMTQLFGGFEQAFYDEYLQYHPLDKGWQNRLDLYNLYHLLNHLKMLGKSYLSRVRSILQHYH